MSRPWRLVKIGVGCALTLATIAPGSFASADAVPTFIPRDSPWLTTVNYFREMAGLSHVSENPTLSTGAYQHSCYMLQNGISHDEVPGKPGYTIEGDAAGNNGNVAVSSAFGASARSHIELWMTGPFHAIGVLRPNLKTVGFGKCDNQATSPWRSGATLDVLHGLGPNQARSTPVLFPGHGTTTSLNRFIVETPDPLPFCGWSGTAGLPVIALMPEAVNSSVSATITGPDGPLETCALSRLNTNGTAQAILKNDNGVIAIARQPLEPGLHTVTVTTQARTATWSFTVDPNAANGVAAAPPAPATPLTVAAPSGPAVGFQPLTPARVVDTRESVGATQLLGGVTKTIQITGHGGVPTGASAVSANLTVVGPVGAGYLTVWNCSAVRPVVSTVNFAAGEVTPNAATVPLDANGRLCVYANSTTHLVIDVNGYFADSGSTRFTPVTPVRLMDTRVPIGPSSRMAGGQTVELRVAGTGGVPEGISAVALNVTSLESDEDGFVTVYPCDRPRPAASSLNPAPHRVRPNLVITPVSSSGMVCLYTLKPVDLVVDVTGYLSDGSAGQFTPSTPFRFVDTRDLSRIEINQGTGGTELQGGSVLTVPIAGVRGVPVDAIGVSLNLTITGGHGNGYITAWPCGPRPTTSTANYAIGTAVSNGAQLPLAADGTLCLYSPYTVHVILDVNGWWS
jgi:Cysteine-rich secretory protein family